MTIEIIQTITNILNEDRSIKASRQLEAYMLIPAKNKCLKHIQTGEIISTRICVNKKSDIKYYVEIDIPTED